jgi:hypothetical protein
LAGCGSSDKPSGAKVAADVVQANAGPEKTVFQFLEAVRVGNDKTASDMLTNLAREKTSEMQLVVAPPGSETATFKVGEVEYIGEAGAHVASHWSDIGDDGKPHTEPIVWILRREPIGWRISGMGTKLFDDQAPMLLNFEDPEDMIRKQRLAEAEIQRRGAAPEASQASKPADDSAAQRK